MLRIHTFLLVMPFFSGQFPRSPLIVTFDWRWLGCPPTLMKNVRLKKKSIVVLFCLKFYFVIYYRMKEYLQISLLYAIINLVMHIIQHKYHYIFIICIFLAVVKQEKKRNLWTVSLSPSTGRCRRRSLNPATAAGSSRRGRAAARSSHRGCAGAATIFL